MLSGVLRPVMALYKFSEILFFQDTPMKKIILYIVYNPLSCRIQICQVERYQSALCSPGRYVFHHSNVILKFLSCLLSICKYPLFNNNGVYARKILTL